MKVSISLPDDEVEFLDAYAMAQGIGSRSAVVQKAVRLLRGSELGPAYEDAWHEWSTSDEAGVWEPTVDDGFA